MGLPTYASREAVAFATDYKSTALQSAAIDRLLDASSRTIERLLHRHFYPLIDTRVYRTDNEFVRAFSYPLLYLEADLLSVTSIEDDGTAVDAADYDLEPSRYGPPYTAVYVSGSPLSIEGVWGYSNDTAPAGALAAAITDAAATTLTVTDASKIGVGDLIKIDTEQLIVTEKGLATTTTTLAANLTADNSEVLIAVASGPAVKTGETVTIDSERMLVTDVAGNDLIVKRAYDGSVLAAHTSGVTVYAPRLLTVERGSVGSTAATHLNAAAIVRNVPPGPIVELCIAETITALEQESAGYGRTVGEGEGQREAVGKSIADLRAQVMTYRRYRTGAI